MQVLFYCRRCYCRFVLLLFLPFSSLLHLSLSLSFFLSAWRFFYSLFRRCVCLKHILVFHSPALLLFLPNGIITIHFDFVIQYSSVRILMAATTYSTLPSNTYGGLPTQPDQYRSGSHGQLFLKSTSSRIRFLSRNVRFEHRIVNFSPLSIELWK